MIVAQQQKMSKISPVEVVPVQEINETGKKEIVEKEEASEKEWGNPIEFLMTLLSFAVGLGNVWR